MLREVPNWAWAIGMAVILLFVVPALLPLFAGSSPTGSEAPTAVNSSALGHGIFWAVILSIVAFALPWKEVKVGVFGLAVLVFVLSFFFSGFWKGVEREIVRAEHCVAQDNCANTNPQTATVLPASVTIPQCGGPDDYVIVDVPRGSNVSWTWSVVAYAITDGGWALVPPDTDAGDTVEAFAYCADKAQHAGNDMSLYWF